MDEAAPTTAVHRHPSSPTRISPRQPSSNSTLFRATTDPEIVMAEQITNDVVKEAQSMGGPSPIDAPATTTNRSAGDGEAPSGPTTINAISSKAPVPTSTSATDAKATTVGSGDASEKAGEDVVTKSGVSEKSGKDIREQLVNGDSGEHSAFESQQAIGDASGGSDTDISRPGSVDQAKRAAGHLRSNSVKKTAAFKSVSVTKNFLAKSAVSTPATRQSEKSIPAGQSNAPPQQPTAKPRLVAKSGAGNAPRALSKMNGAGSGPDASKVWNKNQPVPPPPPKQFTDEELKQQYGIHLATRLQADETGKEAKWADIDDDEDDWAPDTVQWMDGTKSTVVAAENQAPPEEPKPAAKEAPQEAPKPAPPSSWSTQQSSTTGGNKTILKPGAHSQSGPPGRSGLVFKGQAEKPALVAKPSPSGPAKSPWATLPPVDKVSPIPIHPPAQQPPPSRFAQREHSHEAVAPGSAKEIAPDDFNRSWREDRGNRELFNSHSGRYEPVNDVRRGSMRDGSFRQQPSLLQRPSHDGPAEPSPAFQTSRSSAELPAWDRRRASSTVSGGSGRRLSTDRRGHDLPPVFASTQRRESSHPVVNGMEPPPRPGAGPAPARVPAPEAQQQEQAPPPPGSQGSQGSPAASSPAAAEAAVPNMVEAQAHMMKEKKEQARRMWQQRQEQEAREEAARKERLAKKIAAMGLDAASRAAAGANEAGASRAGEQSPPKEKAAPGPAKSPPKPPVPTAEGEVAQYGVMKVHQPQPVKKQYHPELAPPPRPVKPDSPVKPSPPPVKAAVERDTPPKPAAPSPLTAFTRNRDNSSARPSEQTQLSPLPPASDEHNKSSQPPAALTSTPHLAPAQPSTQHPPPPTWSASLHQQSRPSWTSNVWGPPQAKDRALGNGTFDSGYNRTQPRPASQQLPAQSASASTASLGLTPGLKTPSSQSSQPALQKAFSQSTMYAQGGPVSGPAGAVAKPGPIAPPAPVDSGWGNFAAAIARDDRDVATKARQNLERLGESFRPDMSEKFKDHQGKTGPAAFHGNRVANDTVNEGASNAPVTQAPAVTEVKPANDVTKPVTTDGPASQASGQPAPLQSNTQGARSSRFFPRPAEAPVQPSGLNKNDSPPPPETESHPAFTGDTHHPQVKLPKPSPVVRLPPAATESATRQEPSVSMPSNRRPGLGAKPLALTQEWQARFNSLLDKPTPTTPALSGKAASVAQVASKPGSLAVAVSSKAPLEDRAHFTPATVSLPSPKRTFVEDDSQDTVTRTMAEDMMLEEREFGSLPTVKPPKMPHLAANEPSVGFPPTYRPNSKLARFLDVDTETKESLDMENNDKPNGNTVDVVVHLNGKAAPVTKPMTKKREVQKGAKNVKTNNRGFTSNGASNNPNVRGRKSSNYQGQNNSSNSVARNGVNAWSSNRSTQAHNNTNNNNTWARRAAAPVH